MKRAGVFAVVAIAGLIAPVTSRAADTVYTAPYESVELAGSCSVPVEADCAFDRSADAATGAVSATAVSDAGARPAGYGAASATALVVRKHFIAQSTPRLPISITLDVSSASSQAGVLHSMTEKSWGAPSPSAATVLRVVLQHSSCSYSSSTLTRYVTTSLAGENTFSGTVSFEKNLGALCSSHTSVRSGTLTIKAGVYAYANLGMNTVIDSGAASSTIRATVSGITVGEYVAPPARTEASAYSTQSSNDHPCPSPSVGVSPPNPHPCFDVRGMETSVKVSVADESGLTTALSVHFLDAAGIDVTPYQSNVYLRVHCGSTASPVLIPQNAAFVKVHVGDEYWPSYGNSPKCRGLVGTSGTVTAEFA